MVRILVSCFFLITIFTFSCTEDDERDLASVEERVAAAKKELIDKLTAPANGWKLYYQPNDLSGSYFLLLEFNDDGEVRIQSDVAQDDGAYFDDTIPYRIDAELGLELIFETYGVFHYFFELEQTGFGGEFEFEYEKEEGDNLIFISKSDLGENKTILVLEPAAAGDAELFSRSLVQNLTASSFQDPQLTNISNFQLILSDHNLSVFLTLDNQYRLIKANYAGVGTSEEEILNSEGVELDYTSYFVPQNEAIMLSNPLEFTLNGQQISISSIGLSDFQETTTTYCDSNPIATHQFAGQIPGLGSVIMKTSLFNGASDFGPETIYIAQPQFILDGDDESLYSGILESFPDTYLFVIFYNVDRGDEVLNAAGLALLNERNSLDLLLRRFDYAEMEGNKLNISLTDSTYSNREFEGTEKEDLFALTDRMFEGGELYMLNFAFRDDLFEAYNGCNNFKFFAFEN